MDLHWREFHDQRRSVLDSLVNTVSKSHYPFYPFPRPHPSLTPNRVFPIHTMTPIWVFPAYPLLLTAPLGANLLSAAATTGRLRLAGQDGSGNGDAIDAVPIALAAVTAQGTGFLISFMVCAAFLYRLMTQKLPRDHQRPGVFISIGPGGFTCAGLGE